MLTKPANLEKSQEILVETDYFADSAFSVTESQQLSRLNGIKLQLQGGRVCINI